MLTVGLVIGTKALLEETHAALKELPVRVVLEQPAIGDLTAFVQKLDGLRPDILVVEVTNLADRMETVFGRIRSSSAAPVLVAVGSAGEPDTIVAAMRSGAGEYLYPPILPKLASAVERIATSSAQQVRANTGGRTLGFLSAKGGCGATTIACHLAMEFQRQTQQKILLADFDMEVGMVRFFLKTKSDYSVLDAANNVHRLDLSFWRALISNGMPRLEVIAAPTAMPAAEQPEEQTFRHVIRFARAHYDWMLVDLGRSLNPLSMTVLEEIDETYLVTTLDVPALFQAKHVAQMLLESGYGRHRLHVLINRMPKRPEVTLQEIEKMLGLPAYGLLPNDYPGLYEAYAAGNLIPAASNLGRQFSRLAAKIAGIPGDRGKRKFALFSD